MTTTASPSVRAERLRVERARVAAPTRLGDAVERQARGAVLRWAVVAADADGFDVELISYDGPLAPLDPPPAARGSATGRSIVVNLVPTGIGCAVGGFAGDAGPVTKLLASCVDLLVTNPNAVNASDLVFVPDNLVYTEGGVIDLFCAGRVALDLPYGNRVGLVLEQADEWRIEYAFNVANAVRAVYGIDVVDVVVTDESFGVRSIQTESGAYVGTIANPEVLLEACGRLLERGATALALASTIGGITPDDYRAHFLGEHPNPVGGAEAVLSHLVSRRFGVPAAHAPLRNFTDFELDRALVDPRSAGEAISATGLASMLIGLRRAPQFTGRRLPVGETLHCDQVVAVVAPASALGSSPVLCASARNVPVLAVHEETILDVTADRLGLEGVVEVGSYAEAAGLVVAIREGLALESIARPLASLVPARARVGAV